MAPPGCTAALTATRGTDADKTDDSSEDSLSSKDGQEENGAFEQYMDNTATIDVFEASMLAGSQGAGKNGKVWVFEKDILPKAMQIILEEGDLLFMPPKYVLAYIWKFVGIAI